MLLKLYTRSTSVVGGISKRVIVQPSKGAQGPQGDAGIGIPTGGGTGQVLSKASATDYDTEWVDQTNGGDVESVNGQTGAVVLDKADVGLGSVPDLDTAAAVADAHTHANMSVLNATTASFTTAQQTKLAGVATGATANQTNAYLLARANHTGTQAIATVTGLQTALDAKYDATNPSNYITSAQAASAAPVQSIAGKTGVVTLTPSDVSLGNVNNTSDAAKPISTATQTALNAKQNTSAIAANGMGVIVHGATAATVRPTGFAVVTWIGSVQPTNAETSDIWVYRA